VPSEAHIVKAYTEEIEQLTGKIAEMGGFAQAAVSDAIDALRKRDGDLAAAVVNGDKRLDAMEAEVAAMVVRLLALRQPMAIDLRTVVASLRISSDLERIGDYAKNIAKRSLILNEMPPTGPISSIYNLSRMAQVMLNQVLDAYASGDAHVAEQLREQDEAVDAAHTGIFRELITYMMEDPRTITACTHLAFIAKNLERVGDHATNIGESVVFQVSGERLTARHLVSGEADDGPEDRPNRRLES
jgi:phosphate transport system protein